VAVIEIFAGEVLSLILSRALNTYYSAESGVHRHHFSAWVLTQVQQCPSALVSTCFRDNWSLLKIKLFEGEIA
jgi:hypothetical protein